MLKSDQIFMSKSILILKEKSSQSLNNNSGGDEHELKKIKKSIASRRQKKKEKIIRKEIRLLKKVALIVVMFCVAWCPYAVITLVAQFSDSVETYVNPFTTALPHLFAKTASIYNPLIYIVSNREKIVNKRNNSLSNASYRSNHSNRSMRSKS